VTTGTAAFAAGGTFEAVGFSAVAGTAHFTAGAIGTTTGTSTQGGAAGFGAGVVFSAAGFTAVGGVVLATAGAAFSAVGDAQPTTGTAAFASGAAFSAEAAAPISGTALFTAAGVFSAVQNVAYFSGGAEFSASGFTQVQSTARGRWLFLHTSPPSQIYATDEIRTRLSAALPAHMCQFDITPTRAQLGARNDSFALTLTGAGSRLRARLVAQLPFGVRVDVMDGAAVSRSGVTSAQTFGSAISIDCEADGWAKLLPHRTNADIARFRTVEVLPWRYGRSVPGKCVRLDAAGRTWLWADHASDRIRSVKIDGQDFDGFEWRNDASGYGSPVTLILTDGVDDGVTMTAVGDGALDDTGGYLITNPADMLYSLCYRAGVELDRGHVAEFRAECLERSIEVSGTIGAMSLQQSMVLMSESIYAVFSRELRGAMRLLPRAGTAKTIAPRYTASAGSSRSSIATRLRVRYALEDNAPLATLEASAPAVELMRGSVLAETTLPLVRDGRTAADVAKRMLQDMARPAYSVPIDRQRSRIVPGDIVSVNLPAYGLAGHAVVTHSEIAEDGSRPLALLRVASLPDIALSALSDAYEPEQYASATVSTQSDDRRIQIRDDSGAPIVGASCVLNGSITRTTDGAGVVFFPASVMPPGEHVIDVRAEGMQPMQMRVTV